MRGDAKEGKDSNSIIGLLHERRSDQEISEKMGRGVIGAEIFQQKIEKRVMEIRRPKKGGPGKQSPPPRFAMASDQFGQQHHQR